MKTITNALALFIPFFSLAQNDCNLQYDGNGDGAVNVEDVLGVLSEFGEACEPGTELGPCGPDSTVLYNGYTYGLVELGEQCWFTENLRTEQYANGSMIPANLSDGEWQSTLSGAVTVYGEDEGCFDGSPDGDACDPEWSLTQYGRLYNWYAVDDARGLCPGGWHIPTDEEWTTVSQFLGGDSIAGYEMKSTFGWQYDGNGSNSSGLSCLPGGKRSTDGGFFTAGPYGNWWSSSPSESNAWFRFIYSFGSELYRTTDPRTEGFAVRCIKGEAVLGCTNPEACNYNELATHDNGTCVVALEPGSICDDGDANTFNDIWDETGCNCTGGPLVAEDGSGPCEGEVSVNYHDIDYSLFEIANQCWFAENLNTDMYANGDPIPTISASTNGAGTACVEEYGWLYNWYAVDDSRGLCPTGWHVPTDMEWISLEVQLGMDEEEAALFGYRGSDQGTRMKSTSGWSGNANGTNYSGFNGFPGGLVYSTGNCTGSSFGGNWWSSSLHYANEWQSYPIYRHLSWEYFSLVKRGYANGFDKGYSVRCVKD